MKGIAKQGMLQKLEFLKTAQAETTPINSPDRCFCFISLLESFVIKSNFILSLEFAE